MVGGLAPFRLAEGLQPSYQTRAVGDEPLQAIVEMHLEEEIVGILITGQVRLNHWCRMRQHVFEPIEEEAMHVREMTRVFVGGPSPWRRPLLENPSRHLPHERHHDIWGTAQRVNNGSDSIHSLENVSGGLTHG